MSTTLRQARGDVASPALAVEELSVTFRRAGRQPLLVLDGVSFTVGPGEFVSLIGPSGCGKTTLLLVIAGLAPPTAGKADLQGRRAAVVFQRPMLLPWRTALGNAIFGLECLEMAPAEARSRGTDLLIRVGLERHLNDYPHQLSEGMKQRVNLARALLVEPDVLLLDEPFASLDEVTRRDMHDLLLELWAAHRPAVLLVSHSLDEVTYLSDRVLVLSDKPTTVRAAVQIDVKRPRSGAAAHDLLESTEFLRRRLSEMFRKEHPRHAARHSGRASPSLTYLVVDAKEVPCGSTNRPISVASAASKVPGAPGAWDSH